jgi:hypothetical protein
MNNREISKNIEQLIPQLSISQMEELFKIIQKNKCNYTVNNNGIFLNLSWLSEEVLLNINNFVKFCLESKEELDKYELEYEELNRQLQDTNNNNTLENIKSSQKQVSNKIDIKNANSRISSSMKFYLLKKKFLRNTFFCTSINQYMNKLVKEEPLLLK